MMATNTQTATIVTLAKLNCRQVRSKPQGLIRTSVSTPPIPFANRSIVTSTNGFAWYLRSVSSGRNRISRVVLSTV